ncbi:unnamed protein product [Strongylus vulgaris]|uniref:Uncharacterized protein n=1 Tax=Strongylus vulgaris TaxID=40348 RepID=A0A3P7JFH2_STRVU|nr:unnamed protein product [Strongylus vulgaris]
MRSSGGLKSAGKSSSKSDKKHPPRRMKAEYEWVKKLLKVQQPGGRYHTPQSKPVSYPWQQSKKSASSHSGGGTYRERSTSSHHGISSTPEVKASPAVGQPSSQTDSSKQQSGGSTISKASESQSKGTSTTASPYLTGSTGRSKSSLEGRSYDSQQSDSDSWSAPEDDSTGSYQTPISRLRNRR